MRVKDAPSALVRRLGFENTKSVSESSHVNLGKAVGVAPGAVEWRLKETPREILPGFQTIARDLESLLGFHGAKQGELGRREAARVIADTVDKTTGLDRLIMLNVLFEGGGGQPAAIRRDAMDETSWNRFAGLRDELSKVSTTQRPTLRALTATVVQAIANERAKAPQQGIKELLAGVAEAGLREHQGDLSLAPEVAAYATNVFNELRQARGGFRDVSNGEWSVVDWNAPVRPPEH